MVLHYAPPPPPPPPPPCLRTIVSIIAIPMIKLIIDCPSYTGLIHCQQQETHHLQAPNDCSTDLDLGLMSRAIEKQTINYPVTTFPCNSLYTQQYKTNAEKGWYLELKTQCFLSAIDVQIESYFSHHHGEGQ